MTYYSKSIHYFLTTLYYDNVFDSNFLLFQKLKAAVGLTVYDICSELESDLGVKYTPEAVAAIASLTEKKIERSADYLEAYAKHAKRSNITADDVKLLTRGNKNLVS